MRRISAAALEIARPLPRLEGGGPDLERHVVCKRACSIADVVPSTLWAAVWRQELTLFEMDGRAWWSVAELEAWASPEARAERHARGGRA